MGSEFIGSRGFRNVTNARHGAGAAPPAEPRRPLSRAPFSGAALCALADHRGHPGGGAAAHHDLHFHGAALRDGHPVAGGILYQRSGAADQPLQQERPGAGSRGPHSQSGQQGSQSRAVDPEEPVAAGAHSLACLLERRPQAPALCVGQSQAPILARHQRHAGFRRSLDRGEAPYGVPFRDTDRAGPCADPAAVPVRDGELVAGAAQPGDHLPARADPADSPAGGGGASLRHGAGCCQFQAFRGARDPGSLECLHHDEGADRAQCRAAHCHAGGRFA